MRSASRTGFWVFEWGAEFCTRCKIWARPQPRRPEKLVDVQEEVATATLAKTTGFAWTSLANSIVASPNEELFPNRDQLCMVRWPGSPGKAIWEFKDAPLGGASPWVAPHVLEELLAADRPLQRPARKIAGDRPPRPSGPCRSAPTSCGSSKPNTWPACWESSARGSRRWPMTCWPRRPGTWPAQNPKVETKSPVNRDHHFVREQEAVFLRRKERRQGEAYAMSRLSEMTVDTSAYNRNKAEEIRKASERYWYFEDW